MRVVRFVKISAYSAKALLKGLSKLGGARNVLCRRDDLKTCLLRTVSSKSVCACG